MEKIRLGQKVKTKVVQTCFGTNGEDVEIPVGTVGIICEVCEDHVEVEIWGDDAPEYVFGAYGYAFDEIEIID